MFDQTIPFWVFRSILVCTLCLLNGLALHSQSPLRLEQLTPEDGLSNGFVTSMCQDERGFLWMGTARGLNRYDGYTFRTWYSDLKDSMTLSENVIWSLFSESDESLWVGTQNGLNHFNTQTEQFTRFFHKLDHPNSLTHNRIVALNQDKDGQIWAGTYNGLSILHQQNQSIKRFGYSPDGQNQITVRDIIRDEADRMWFSGGDTLFCFEPSQQAFLRYPLPQAGSKGKENVALEVIQDQNGFIWVSTNLNGMFKFDSKRRQFIRHIPADPKNPITFNRNPISAVTEVKDKIWVGLNGGSLNILNPQSGTVQRFQADPFNPNHSNMETIRSIWEDKQGNVWIGSFYGGAKVRFQNRQAFQNYPYVPGKDEGLVQGTIMCIQERSDGKVLMLSEEGFSLFDPIANRFEKIPLDAHLGNSTPTHFLIDHQGNIWIVAGGLWRKTSESNHWEPISDPILEDKNLMFIYEDQSHRLWIGTQLGLYQYHPSTGKVTSFPLEANHSKVNPASNEYIYFITEDSQGGLWISTAAGTNYLAPEASSAHLYPYSNKVYAVVEVSDGTLWACTSNGLATVDRSKQKIIPSEKFSETINDEIGVVHEDQQGRLWALSGTTGWYRLDPSGSSRQYTPVDGYLNVQVMSGLKTKSGDIYVGGDKGFYRFNPSDIQDNPFRPQVALIDIKVRNQSMPIQGSHADTLTDIISLPRSITYLQQLDLPYWQNDFSLHFSALDFGSSQKSNYEYQLVGYDQRSTLTDAENRSAYYTNLDWGTYTFKVKASNSDGFFGDYTNLKITIHPPWWATWWAYLLYFLIIAGILYSVYRFQLQRKLAQAENQRLQELNLVKSQLYTNITHEFRTPLTVILGMAEQLKEQVTEVGKSYTQLIHRNGQLLLRLVNQMLDLSKLESGNMSLNMIQSDLIHYLQYIIESFHSLADQTDVQLHFDSEIEQLTMDFDPEHIQQILSNLISNAIKFTPEGGDVFVSAKTQGNWLQVEVRDTGIGISQEQLPFIFDRFYQGDASTTRRGEGTGIGLALTKQLMQLLGGTIEATSSLGKGATLTLRLPITHQAPLSKKTTQLDRQAMSGSSVQADLPLAMPFQNEQAPQVLLIEDNPDVITYLTSILKDHYLLEVAQHGQEGIEKAIEQVPDLIVSDVMMPQKNGFEVCQILKEDERTSHIPIILLTAKADMDSKLSGLAKGADAYLAKPFHVDELLVRIHQLIESRRRLQQYYRSDEALEAPTEQPPELSPEEQRELEFLQKVRSIIESHLHDEQFSVTHLATAMYYSEAQLYRKIKSVTGLSPGKFIRSIRIQQAKRLLMQPDLPVTTVAYDTGFQNPEYFSKVFKKEVGKTPSEFRQDDSEGYKEV